MYRVELTSRAQRELDELRGKEPGRIIDVLAGLPADPRPHGVKKLRGPIHRIRVGDWRVVYAVFERDKLVIAGKIARRSEKTCDGLEGLF